MNQHCPLPPGFFLFTLALSALRKAQRTDLGLLQLQHNAPPPPPPPPPRSRSRCTIVYQNSERFQKKSHLFNTRCCAVANRSQKSRVATETAPRLFLVALWFLARMSPWLCPAQCIHCVRVRCEKDARGVANGFSADARGFVQCIAVFPQPLCNAMSCQAIPCYHESDIHRPATHFTFFP